MAFLILFHINDIFSVYLPKQCSHRAQIYVKSLEIPTIDLFPRFIVFIRQLKDGIGER